MRHHVSDTFFSRHLVNVDTVVCPEFLRKRKTRREPVQHNHLARAHLLRDSGSVKAKPAGTLNYHRIAEGNTDLVEAIYYFG